MKACMGQTNVPKGTTEGGNTHIDGNMRHWFDIIGKVNPSAIPSLQSIRHLLGSAFVSPIERKRKGTAGRGRGRKIARRRTESRPAGSGTAKTRKGTVVYRPVPPPSSFGSVRRPTQKIPAQGGTGQGGFSLGFNVGHSLVRRVRSRPAIRPPNWRRRQSHFFRLSSVRRNTTIAHAPASQHDKMC